MKGTVVATWLNTTRKLFGDDVVKNAMSYAGWGEHKIFSMIFGAWHFRRCLQ